MPVLTDKTIEALENELLEKKKQLALLRQKLPNIKVKDYQFLNHNGSTTKLSEMFGKHQYLVVIHNMGQGCKYCTMWANGFEGIYKHFDDKAGFVLVNSDTVEKQKIFSAKQGWTYPVYSAVENSFTEDLGFQDDKSLWPGTSTFTLKADGSIELMAQAVFGPGDDYCSVWHFYDLLPAKFDY